MSSRHFQDFESETAIPPSRKRDGPLAGFLWMWSLVDDRIRTALRGSEAVRMLTDRLEAEVRSGRMIAATASDQIVEVLGLRI